MTSRFSGGPTGAWACRTLACPVKCLAPPVCLLIQFFGPLTFFCLTHPVFVVKQCITNLLIRLIIVSCLSSYITVFTVYCTINNIFIHEDLFYQSSPFSNINMYSLFMAPLQPTRFLNPRTAIAGFIYFV